LRDNGKAIVHGDVPVTTKCRNYTVHENNGKFTGSPHRRSRIGGKPDAAALMFI
jgi:hypothetical protein